MGKRNRYRKSFSPLLLAAVTISLGCNGQIYTVLNPKGG